MKPPVSELFTTVDLAGRFNARRSDLSETLATPDVLSEHFGANVFRGMPFELGPRDGSNVLLLDRETVEIPLNGAVATYIVFLHVVEDRLTNYHEEIAHFQVDGNELGNHVSNYVVRFGDGSEHLQSIQRRFAIQQARIHWGASAFAAVPVVEDDVQPATAEQIALQRPDVPMFGPGEVRTRSGRDGRSANAWLFALRNPHPDRPLESIRLQPMTERSAIYGMSLAQVREHPLRNRVRRKLLLTLPKGVALNAIGELDDVAIDLGKVISARRQFVYDHEQWSRCEPDVQPEASKDHVVIEYAAHPQAKLHVGVPGGGAEVYDLEVTSGPTISEIRPATSRVRIEITDKASGQPVGVRLHLHGEQGEYLPPRGYHRKVNPNWFEDHYAEFANSHNQYVYVDGMCEADLPQGRVYIDISRGYEVTPLRTHFEVEPETDTMRFELERVLDWRSDGWVTADTHVHFLSPATAQLEGSAEDVNVVNVLASQWGEMFSNVGDFDGRTTHGARREGSGTESASDGEFLVRVGTENRMQVLGHISLLGYSGQMIHPLCTGGPSESAIGDPQEVTMADWAQRCIDQKGLVVMPHGPNPQCERAADVVLGVIHAMEMMTFNPHDIQISPYGIADWYRYQNLGYQLPLVGGSDKMGPAWLLGGVRTYTQLGDRTFTYESWMDATRAGHTFVTVGPLVDMQVEDATPGTSVTLPESGGTVTVSWRAESVRVPISAVEVVVGGRTTDVHRPTDPMAAQGTVEVSVTDSTWIAVRVRGGYDNRTEDIAAHTSAVQVLVGSRPIHASDDALEVLKQIEGAMAFIDTIAARPEADAYRKLRLTLESAWTRLHQRMHQNGDFHEHSPLHDHAEHHEH